MEAISLGHLNTSIFETGSFGFLSIKGYAGHLKKDFTMRKEKQKYLQKAYKIY